MVFRTARVGTEQFIQRHPAHLIAQLFENSPGIGFRNQRHRHLYQKRTRGTTSQTLKFLDGLFAGDNAQGATGDSETELVRLE